MIVATLLLFAATADEPKIDCDNASMQFELNACAHQEYERADAAMNVQWKITSARMKELDVEFGRNYDKRPGHFETLLAGQRAWLTYRERHCTSEGYAMRGGSAEPMVFSGCMTQLTEARTKQLKDLIEEY